MITLACDWGQTRSLASGGWKLHTETNPIMGRDPSARTVDMYFASAAAITALAWWLLPERLRPFLSAGVVGVQLPAIVGNTMEREPVPLCGVGGDPVR
jgi:hypothetical protein